MGLLKHVLLPAFGLMHVASVAACSDLTTWAGMIGLPKESVSDKDKESVRQNHMLGCLRGFNLAMGVLCTMGIFMESAHFRAQVILTEAVMFSVATIDAMRLGTLNWTVPALHAAVALAGFVVNSLEPGIFTKDRNA